MTLDGWETINDGLAVRQVSLWSWRWTICLAPDAAVSARTFFLIVLLGGATLVELSHGPLWGVVAGLLLLSAASGVATVFTDPGVVPPNPQRPTNGAQVHNELLAEVDGDYAADWTLACCRVCEVLKPRGATHCRQCNVCIAGFDHHCAFLGCCIGARNHRWFLCFVFSTWIAGVLGGIGMLLDIDAAIKAGHMGLHMAVVPWLITLVILLISMALALFSVFSIHQSCRRKPSVLLRRGGGTGANRRTDSNISAADSVGDGSRGGGDCGGRVAALLNPQLSLLDEFLRRTAALSAQMEDQTALHMADGQRARWDEEDLP